MSEEHASPEAEAPDDDVTGLDFVADAEVVDDDELGDAVAAAGDDPGADAARERDEYLDALRRLQAEFENYRKRTDRQRIELSERAAESVLESLLPVADALDLAVAHIGAEEGSESANALAQIGALLRDTLARAGLERIDEVGVEFDPTIHDGVAHVEAEEESERGRHIVDAILRSGYQLKGRVVRPAMVRVRG